MWVAFCLRLPISWKMNGFTFSYYRHCHIIKGTFEMLSHTEPCKVLQMKSTCLLPRSSIVYESILPWRPESPPFLLPQSREQCGDYRSRGQANPNVLSGSSFICRLIKLKFMALDPKIWIQSILVSTIHPSSCYEHLVLIQELGKRQTADDGLYAPN